MIRLKELRASKKWRQEDLAKLLSTTQQTVARYENGEREPDIDTICRLCEIFGCTADYLLGRSTNASPVITDDDASLLEAYHAAPYSVASAICTLLQPYKKENEADQAI